MLLLGNTAGRKEEFETGTLTKVWVNPTGKRQKVGGTTFDWSTVDPLGADLTLSDGTVIKAGTRCLLYGTFFARITSGDSAGYYGIYDETANDGRQLRNRDDIFFTDSTILFEDRMSGHVAGFFGGQVYEARMKLSELASPNKPKGHMTKAQAVAAFPLLNFFSSGR